LGLPPGGNGRVYQSPGGQLWTVMPEGLEEYTEGAWHFHGIPRIVGTYPSSARIIDAVPLMPVKQGLVLLMLPSGLMQFSASRTGSGQMTLLHSAGDGGIGEFSGMTLGQDGGLWITGSRGVAKAPGPVRNLKAETVWEEFPVPEWLAAEKLQ